MKAPPIQFRREFALVGGVTLLALVPLFFLWRKSVLVQSQTSLLGNTSTLVPIVGRMALGKNSYIAGVATLSPDGRWLARMEVAESELGVESAPGSLSLMADELVIRSAGNGKEQFRALAAGQFVGWIPGTLSFVARNGNDINVFAPAVRAPGGPLPTQPWTQTTISFPADVGGIYSTTGAHGSTVLELQAGAIAFSPDYRFAVKGSWGQGAIMWEVADLTTGKVAPPVQAGRWLNYDPRVGGVSSDISIAVAPASIAPGKLPLVSVLQTTRRLPDPSTYRTPQPRPMASPTPTPFPTPLPTPTYSPAQAQFQEKEKRETASIEALVGRVEGVDGEEPEVTDEAEIARITAEVERRVRALDLEKKRVFPPVAMATSRPSSSPTALSKARLAALVKPFRVETFDLNSGKRLWTSAMQGEIFSPVMKFSPDGSALVSWGQAVPCREKWRGPMCSAGMEFYAPTTGQSLGKTQLYDSMSPIPNENQVVFYADASATVNGTPRSVLVFKDVCTGTIKVKGTTRLERNTVFRLFNAVNAHETGYLKVNVAQFPQELQNFERFSVSRGGVGWLLGNSDVYFLSRGTLGEEKFGAVPTPTPEMPMKRR